MECLSARTSAFVLAASLLMAPPSHAEESQSTLPSYIEADRTQAEETLGAALANDVFSDRFTALRKRLVASSLRANPAAGCGNPPAFTLPIDLTSDGPSLKVSRRNAPYWNKARLAGAGAALLFLLGVTILFRTEYGTQWGAIGAAALLISTPVIAFAILMQKYLVRGLTMGSIR